MTIEAIDLFNAGMALGLVALVWAIRVSNEHLPRRQSGRDLRKRRWAQVCQGRGYPND